MWQCAGRDRDYASTSYDSPHFARRQSGGSFVSRQSDHQDFSPARNHSKYDDYGDSSSSDYRQANSIPSEDESMDEGELRPTSRSAALYNVAKAILYLVAKTIRRHGCCLLALSCPATA